MTDWSPTIVTPILKLLGLSNEPEEFIQSVTQGVEKWAQATRTTLNEDGFRELDLVRSIADAVGLDMDQVRTSDFEDLLQKPASQLLQQLRAAIDSIDAMPLSIIEYRGDEEYLPIIFEKINQAGTDLTRWDVLAATWLEKYTAVHNPAIVEAIEAKYEVVIEEGYEVQDISSDRQEDGYSLFEYCFGLGKMLAARYPLLLKASKNPAATDPWAFACLATVYGLRIDTQMDLLAKKIPTDAGGVRQPDLLEERLLLCFDELTGALSKYLKLAIGTKKGPLIAHSDNQIVSMVCRLFVGRWNPDVEGMPERPGWQADWKKLRSSLPHHYLFDMIREFWRGPLYSHVRDRVWGGTEGAAAATPSDHYLERPSRVQWEDALSSWFEDHMRREQRKNTFVRKVDKVFLKFLYSDVVSVGQQEEFTFDVEHLIPAARLKALIDPGAKGWPMSCIGNLALLDSKLNQAKGKATLLEYVGGLSGDLADDAKGRAETYALIPLAHLVVPQEGESARQEFEAFLTERWEAMKEILFQRLSI